MRQKIRKGILTYMALLFPILFLFMSPYFIIAAASAGFINGSAIVFSILLITSIVGSRLFCGWLCPGGIIQDQIANANSRQWNGRWRNFSKYIIWVIWFSFIIYLWIQHKQLKINIFYMINMDAGIVITYFMILTMIFIFTVSTGKRGMCHSLCWMAPFMVIGEKVADFLHIPRFRLKAESNKCISCGQCNKRCPMSLNISEMVKTNQMNSTECITCLECVDVCPKKAISCGIKSKK